MHTDEIVLLSRRREIVKSGRAAQIREAAHLSQSEIARTVGVTSATVSRWESGTRRPRGAAADRYFHLLGMLEGKDAA